MGRVIATVIVACVALAAPGCQQKTEPVATPYARDVERICHAAAHAGVGPDQAGRSTIIAEYLARNLESDEGRALSIELSQISNPERIELLAAEAKRFAVADCAMLDEWRGK